MIQKKKKKKLLKAIEGNKTKIRTTVSSREKVWAWDSVRAVRREGRTN